jgi:hypothetical protein
MTLVQRAPRAELVTGVAPSDVAAPVAEAGAGSRSTNPPPVFVALVSLAALGATLWSAATHSMVLYGDARAHLDVARHVTDGLRTGLTQLGSVWLPLPHLLLVPLVAIDPLWHSGAAGAIVSGLCFVYSAVRLFSIIAELTGSRLAAWIGAAVFVVNLNILYIQSTALTEPVLLACMIGTVYHLTRWMRTLSVWDLMWAGVLVFCATLTRYEGWALLAGSIVVVAVWSRLADRRRKAPQANVVVYALVGSYGIGLWLLYNLIIFGNAFYFLSSAYSAQAINGSQAQFGLLGTKGDLVQSLLTYGWAVVGIVGPIVLVTSGVATAVALAVRDPQRRRTVAVLVLLFVPVLFEVLSLYAGQTTIRVPQLAPHGMWNDRYGLMALPFCAVAIGVLVSRLQSARITRRWTIPVVTGAVIAGTVAMSFGTPLALADGRTGTSSATAGHPEVIAQRLQRDYRGGEILADDSVASPLMFASGLDLRNFVTIGFHPFWEHALRHPARNVDWVVAFPGDRVWNDMHAHPGRFDRFRLVTTQGRVRLYHRTPTAISTAPSTRATSTTATSTTAEAHG